MKFFLFDRKLLAGIASVLLLLLPSEIPAQTEADVLKNLPRSIRVSASTNKTSHVQGVAVDIKNGYAYFSFTTELVKTDLQGNVIGTITGLTCHLGCLDLDTESGKLYASVEYKDDAIGKGIMQKMGKSLEKRENTFYIGIFDTKLINRKNIDAQTGGVMRTVYLPEVVSSYEDTVVNLGHRVAHRYDCSGIDGISVGPDFGGVKENGKRYLCVALGSFGNQGRNDNDYQVLLQFDLAKLDKFARPLDQNHPHHSGPKRARRHYFAFTGNTKYGIQNLEYDPATHYWLAAVYKGRKPQYPNYSLYAFDGTKKARKEPLKGFDIPEKGYVLSLADAGLTDSETKLRGWNFPLGSTGLEALGGGYFYISKNGKDSEGRETCNLRLYRWNGRNDGPFEEVK